MFCILNNPYSWKKKYFCPQAAWVVPWGTSQLCREFTQVREKTIAPRQRIGKHISEFFDLADILTTLQLPCIILLSDSEHPGYYCLWTLELPLQFFLLQVKEITFGQLRERVREVAAALKRWRAFDYLIILQKKQPAPSSSSSWSPPPSSGLASLLATVWPATSPTAPRRSLPWRRRHL